MEEAVQLGDVPLEEQVAALLEPALDVAATNLRFNPVGRLVGQAEEHLGRFEAARDHHRRALVATRQIRHRPEAAICAYHLAKLLLEHFPEERAEAASLLDTAIPEFQDMGMPVYLEEAMRLKLGLQGVADADPNSSIVAVQRAVAAERPNLASRAAPDGTVTLLFSDIENSTALNEGMGDTQWMAILRAHNAIIEEQVRTHGGAVVKTMGDGYMVAFSSARRGLECALAIQRALTPSPSPDFAGEGSKRPLDSIRVRIGLHTGEMQKEGDDFFGKHVNLAARVGAAAVGGQVLVSSPLKDLVAPSGQFAFDDGTELTLKGLAGTHRVYAVLAAERAL